MSMPELQEIAALLARTRIAALDLQTPEGHLRLRRQPGSAGPVDPSPHRHATASASDVAAASGEVVLPAVMAPSVGVFLHQHPLRSTPLASPGATVEAGQTVGLLQIGALLLPVNTPQAGVIAQSLVAHGHLVGYGTPILALQPLLAPATKP